MNTMRTQIIDNALLAGIAAADDSLALLQEGFLKTVLMRALLAAGYTLREGSPRTNEDWLIRGLDPSLIVNIVDRTGSGECKPDIRVELPVALRFELKVFGEFGTKDTFNKAGIGSGKNSNSFLWDLDAVHKGLSDVALFVCGARQYDTARGDKWDGRGKKSEISLANLLPRRAELVPTIRDFERSYQGRQWTARGLVASEAPSILEYAKNGSPRRSAERRIAMALWPAV